MPDVTGKGYIYGLRDIKITNLAGTTQVDLPASQTLTWEPQFIGDSLRGDDTTVASIGQLDKIEWNLSHGGISLEAMAIMTGKTVTTSGTTPNRTEKMTFKAGDNMPYFKIYGRAMGDAGDGLHVIIKKAKVTSMAGGLEDQTWLVSELGGEAVGDNSGDIYDIIKLETDTNLPTT